MVNKSDFVTGAHWELIACPECETQQAAIVEHTVLFGSYNHTCIKCGYTIMESEWNRVIELSGFTPLIPGKFITQVPITNEFPLRALTWNQPFAELMLHGKQETRERQCHVRGWVLICAAQKPYTGLKVQNIAGEVQGLRIAAMELKHRKDFDVTGHAIAIGYIHNSRPMVQADEHCTYVQYVPGKWVWEFRDVHRIKPIPFTGKQGWGFVTDFETLDKIEIVD